MDSEEEETRKKKPMVQLFFSLSRLLFDSNIKRARLGRDNFFRLLFSCLLTTRLNKRRAERCQTTDTHVRFCPFLHQSTIRSPSWFSPFTLSHCLAYFDYLHLCFLVWLFCTARRESACLISIIGRRRRLLFVVVSSAKLLLAKDNAIIVVLVTKRVAYERCSRTPLETARNCIILLSSISISLFFFFFFWSGRDGW